MLQLLLRFCVLGSVFGGGAFVVARDLAALDAPFSIEHSLATFLISSFLGFFLSVPLGLFPASISGVSYWAVLRWCTRVNPGPLVRATIGAILGGAVCAIFGGLLFAKGTGPGTYSVGVNVFAWAVAGLFGGAVSALTSGRITYALAIERSRALRPNPSMQPTGQQRPAAD